MAGRRRAELFSADRMAALWPHLGQVTVIAWAGMRGVVTLDKAQLVFIDTPGIFAPKRRLDRAMVESAWGGAGDADLVAFVDADCATPPAELERMGEAGRARSARYSWETTAEQTLDVLLAECRNVFPK